MCTFLSFGMLAELIILRMYEGKSSYRCTQQDHRRGCEERWLNSAGRQKKRQSAWKMASEWCSQSSEFSERTYKLHSLHPEHVHLGNGIQLLLQYRVTYIPSIPSSCMSTNSSLSNPGRHCSRFFIFCKIIPPVP